MFNTRLVFDTAFTFLSYEISWIELVGVVFGLLSVGFAIRAKVWAWHLSIVSQAAYFFLFYHINLYSDVFLQVFFTIISIYGIKNWRQAVNNDDLPILRLSMKAILAISVTLIAATAIWGSFIAHIHELLPVYFAEAASFPYSDGFIAMASVAAITLQARRYLEAWVLWTVVNAVAAALYQYKGIYYTSVLYLVFLGMGLGGWVAWRKKIG